MGILLFIGAPTMVWIIAKLNGSDDPGKHATATLAFLMIGYLGLQVLMG